MAAYEAYKRAKMTPEMKRREARMGTFAEMTQEAADAALQAMQIAATAHVEKREWEDALFHMNDAEALVRARRGAKIDPVRWAQLNVARGRVLVELQRFHEAVELFDAALKHYLVKEPMKDESKPKSYKAKKAPFDLWYGRGL